MKKYKEVDIAVIGAGMGGLSSAGLWAKRGSRVCLIESHSTVGGCAGYFKRREGYYDVGATTLSGLSKGRPTRRLIDELGLSLDLISCDPGIVSHLGNKTFRFYKDIDKLSQEVKSVFNLDFNATLVSWIEIESLLWEILDIIKPLDMLNLNVFKDLVLSHSAKLAKHPKIFYKTFFDILPDSAKENKEFVRFIDELLMISTQQSSRSCPAFMGILGFLYPRDTYAIKGGMYGLCKGLVDKNKELGVDIMLKNPCIEIIKKDNFFFLETKKEIIKAKKLISNISPAMFNKLYSASTVKAQDTNEIWGAMSAYFAVKTTRPIIDLYNQIHVGDSSLFFSISKHGDSIKSSGYQMITVSSHVNKKKFKSRDDLYNNEKKNFEKLVLKTFKEKFNKFGIEEVLFDSVGTPLTFLHYTGRSSGEVGGLIHKSIFSLNRLMSNRPSSERDIYFTGDYSFPGQGIVSVFQSAFNTLE